MSMVTSMQVKLSDARLGSKFKDCWLEMLPWDAPGVYWGSLGSVNDEISVDGGANLT